MSILRPAFNGIITIYTIDVSTSTVTGAPIETLQNTGLIYDIVKMKEKVSFDVTINGNIRVEDFRFLCEKELDVQTTIVENDGIKYRLKNRVRQGINSKTFAWLYTAIKY